MAGEKDLRPGPRSPSFRKNLNVADTLRELRSPKPSTETGWLRVYTDVTEVHTDYPGDPGVEATVAGVRGVAPLFKSNWQHVGDPYAPISFHLSDDGEVRFRGHMRGGDVGTDTPAFRLPIGYRPEHDMTFIVPVDSGGYATILITANDGHVYVAAITGI